MKVDALAVTSPSGSYIFTRRHYGHLKPKAATAFVQCINNVDVSHYHYQATFILILFQFHLQYVVHFNHTKHVGLVSVSEVHGHVAYDTALRICET